MKSTVLALVVTLTVAAPAFAHTDPDDHDETAHPQRFELSGGWTGYDGKEGGLIHAGTVRGAYYINEHFGLEAEASFGIDGTEVDIDDRFYVDRAEIELDDALSGFFVFRQALSEGHDVFARIGLTSSSLSMSAYSDRTYWPGEAAYVETLGLEGASFGLGGHLALSETVGVRADYTWFQTIGADFEGGISLWSLSTYFRF